MPRDDEVHLTWKACYDIFNMLSVIFCGMMNYRSENLTKSTATDNMYDKNDFEIK